MSFDPLAERQLADARARAKGRRTSEIERFKKYINDPVAFFVDVLGITPWSKQRELIEAVARYDSVAAKAGQKVSKSNTLAGLALWFACTRNDARVVYTNSSARQVREVNFRELRKLARKARKKIGGTIFDTPDRGIEWDDGRQIVGFSTDEPDRWGGISGANLMFLVDEASGVPAPIFDAIFGNSAGGNSKIVLTGNPLRADNEHFHQAFTSASSPYHQMTISSYDSPNVTGEAHIVGLATLGWIRKMIEAYGDVSAFVSARIRGEFPGVADGQLIPLALAAEAKQRWRREDFIGGGLLEVGVDVARFGDDESVVFARRGNVVLPPYVFRQIDTVELAERVRGIVKELRRDDEVPIVRVDVIGIGAGVVDQLRRDPTIRVTEVNVGESAGDERFARKRDHVWWSLKEWLEQGGSIPPDPKLEGELCAAQYHYTSSAKIQIEGKDELKKRLGGRSPDRADALALAVFKDGWRVYGASSSCPSPMNDAYWDQVGDRPVITNLIGFE